MLRVGHSSSDTPHYEQVPFEVPEGWAWTTVSEISKSILYGVSESAKTSGAYKLLRITDIQENNVEWNTVPYTDYDESKVGAYLLEDNDILFARTGATVGKSYLVKGLREPSIYASYLIRVQTFNDILPQYVKYFFESGFYWEQIERGSVGIGQPNVNGTTLGNLQLPIPPINEQERIVEELKKWLGVITAIESNKNSLQGYIELAKSKILDLAIHGKLVPQDPEDEPAIDLLRRINPKFTPCDNAQYGQIPETWLSVPLEALFDINPKNKLDDNIEVGFVPMGLVSDGYSGTHSFERRKWTEVKRGYCHFANGDIGVAKISPCFENLKSTLFDNLPNGYGAGTTELVIMRSNGVYSKFYLYLFKSKWYVTQGTKYFKGVVGQQRVNREIFTTLHVPLPPLAEQHRIVARIEQLFSTLDTIQASLT